MTLSYEQPDIKPDRDDCVPCDECCQQIVLKRGEKPPVICPRCGHLYITWKNYKKVLVEVKDKARECYEKWKDDDIREELASFENDCWQVIKEIGERK